MKANDKQVAGTHYQNTIQHWDWVASNDLDYFQGQITKYVARWKKKNGIEDLEKAAHFLDKYIELAKENKVADVTVNVTGMTSVGSASISTAPLARWRVIYQDKVVFSASREQEAISWAEGLNLKHEGSPYTVVDGEPGSPTSAYVNQG